MSLTSQDPQAIVDTHNKYRSDPAINTPNIQWDSTLATGAQAWADNLATTVHQLQHSDPGSRQGLGENIASGATGNRTAAQLADLWKTQEQPYFKPGIFPNVTTDPTKTVGHYTQVIWGATTRVGCGMATDSTTGQDYLVCRYSPQGNVTGVGVPSPQPVILAQLSAFDANNVFGVDAANNVSWYNSTDGSIWSGSSVGNKPMQLVSVASDGTLCGLDSNGAIWQSSITSSPQTWTQMAAGPVAFRSVSCGSANSIGVMGTDNICYQNTGNGWTKMATVPGYIGSGTLVSVASDGTIVASDANGLLYQYNATSSNWQLIDGGWGFRQFSCGSATNLWGVDFDGKFWKYTGGPGSSRTQVVPGSTGKQISVASDGTAWSIGTNNQVSRLVNNAWTPLLV